MYGCCRNPKSHSYCRMSETSPDDRTRLTSASRSLDTQCVAFSLVEGEDGPWTARTCSSAQQPGCDCKSNAHEHFMACNSYASRYAIYTLVLP